MDTPPAFPTALDSTWLNAPLVNPFLFDPSNLTKPVALIFTLPASPCPNVPTLIRAPLVSSREPVVMDTPPAFPTALDSTWLNAPLVNPFLFDPSNLTKPVALIITLPALPSPLVLASSMAPLVSSSDSVVMDTPPACPFLVIPLD